MDLAHDPRFGRPRPAFPLLTVILVVAVGVLVWDRWLRPPPALHDPDAVPRAVTPRPDLQPVEDLGIRINRRVAPSVVHIRNLALVRDWDFNLAEVAQGEASGFVWDDRGYIVTNFHVVNGGDRFTVTLGDGTTAHADLVGTAPDKDLAVLAVDGIDPSKLPPVAIGTSKDLQVGQIVFAIGNPFGLDHTMTSGIISGLGREIRSKTHHLIRDVIQTDAAINPGNSGGPLLDSAGRVIGVNTAIVSPSGGSAGVGFAVPIDTVNRIVPMLIRGEKPESPGLGVSVLEPGQVGGIGIDGLLVRQVYEGGPGAAAGLRGLSLDRRTGELILGDVIVAIDGHRVRSQTDLFDVLDGKSPGDVVQVKVVRSRREIVVPVKIGSDSPP